MKRPSSGDKPLVLTQGDPAGVGILASLNAWPVLRESSHLALYLRGDTKVFQDTARRFSCETPIVEIRHPDEACVAFRDGLPIIPSGETLDIKPGKADPQSAAGIIKSIEQAVGDVWDGHASAVVTNPISKNLLYAAGFKFPGHTEFLAHLAGERANQPAPLPIMMLVGGGLKVALATIHIPLMTVAAHLTQDLLHEVCEITLDALKHDFGVETPVLGVCGLNPHAGESGTIGSEDEDVIVPIIEQFKARGLSVVGPRPGDTIFHESLNGAYDGIVAMYHDQGLIPVKTLDIWGGVNVTLGLPFVRTSPDHGTGYDAAAQGKVRCESLISAIKLAKSMAQNRSKQT